MLLSGHHAKIAAWRREQALARTRQHRPDLLPAGLEGLVVTAAQPDDAGELLTLQRAAFLAEARLNGSLELPPLTETVAERRWPRWSARSSWSARLRGRLVASGARDALVRRTAGTSAGWWSPPTCRVRASAA